MSIAIPDRADDDSRRAFARMHRAKTLAPKLTYHRERRATWVCANPRRAPCGSWFVLVPSVQPAQAGGSPMKTYRRWRWWTVALRGVAAIALGIFALFAPRAAFLSLVVLFGIYAIVDGVLALSLAGRGARPLRGSLVVRSIISIAAGFIALLWPGITGVALLYVIALWAICAGILEVVMAIQLRKQLEHEWLLGIEGALSIGFGVLLFIAPIAGAVVLGLWLGAYALVLGGMLIATGFRLRNIQVEPAVAPTPIGAAA
jgi:uncharacterized membrane protein HdeD (DUF308 family)